MRAGAPLIYQAQLFDGRWQGRLDFLRRIEMRVGSRRLRLRDPRHEARPRGQAARRPPARALQPAAGGPSRVSRRPSPTSSSATARPRPCDLARYAALHRHIARRLEAIADAEPVATYPEPVDHCGICDSVRRSATGAAGRRRPPQPRRQREPRPAGDAGRRSAIDTVLDLAEATDTADPGSLGPERFALLHHQAELQVVSRDSKAPCHRHLPPRRARGYALLPSRQPGTTCSSTSRAIPTSARRRHRVPLGLVDRRTATTAPGRTTRMPRRRRFERFVDRVVELRARHAGAARLPLRRARALEAALALGQVRDARGRGRRVAA